MIGIDISNWQSGINLSKDDKYIDFGIVKATEGKGFTDKSFSSHIDQLTKLDKLIGCYHFARPDLNKSISGMEAEAQWFVDTVKSKGIIGKAILVLDWETEPMDREDLINAWMNKVVQLTGISPFIYGSRSKLTTTVFKNLINKWPIWMAAWPTIASQKIESAEGYVIDHLASREKVNWKIWQFSSTGKLNGFTGNVDLDYTDMSKEEWLSYAGFKPQEDEHISDDMKWAIDVGLIKGYGNGKYGPKDPLTREQAATLFRRFMEMK